MNYKKNAHFYNFEERNFENSLFENIDATYILHLEGNDRLGHVEEQLTKYIPSRKVIIVYNKGFKKCTKDLPIQCSTYDLIDANLNIIEHSIDNNYSNILILEDDFQFNNSILEDEPKKEIDDFIKKNKDSEFLYYLGSLPLIKTINISNHNQLFLSLGTHSVIISKKMKEKLLLHKEHAKDWDIYLNQFFLQKYTYYTPLCYQVFPETENQKNWGKTENFLGIPLSLFGQGGAKLLRLVELDIKPEPGFSYFYNLSITIILLLYTLIFYVFYLSYKFCKKYIKQPIKEKIE
tara:strand:+ start:1499 stop:2374 length:876 start_codon:yes stop_codon:yes gene_type:complete